jgi:hypothetical protein
MFQHIVEQDPVRFGIMASLSDRAQQRLETLRQEGVITEPIKPTRRSGRTKVEFSVGMIMKHKRFVNLDEKSHFIAVEICGAVFCVLRWTVSPASVMYIVVWWSCSRLPNSCSWTLVLR